MKCVICKTGRAIKGVTTVTLQREETVVVIKGVPADVCENCGEYYLDRETTARVYEQANGAVARNAEVEILRFAA